MSLDIIKNRTQSNIFKKDLWGLGINGSGLYNRLFHFDDYYSLEEKYEKEIWFKTFGKGISQDVLEDAWELKKLKENKQDIGPFMISTKGIDVGLWVPPSLYPSLVPNEQQQQEEIVARASSPSSSKMVVAKASSPTPEPIKEVVAKASSPTPEPPQSSASAPSPSAVVNAPSSQSTTEPDQSSIGADIAPQNITVGKMMIPDMSNIMSTIMFGTTPIPSLSLTPSGPSISLREDLEKLQTMREEYDKNVAKLTEQNKAFRETFKEAEIDTDEELLNMSDDASSVHSDDLDAMERHKEQDRIVAKTRAEQDSDSDIDLMGDSDSEDQDDDLETEMKIMEEAMNDPNVNSLEDLQNRLNTNYLSKFKDKMNEKFSQMLDLWKKHTKPYLTLISMLTTLYINIAKSPMGKIILNNQLGPDMKVKIDKAINAANGLSHFLLDPGENAHEFITTIGNSSEAILEYQVGSNYLRDIKDNSLDNLITNLDSDMVEIKDIAVKVAGDLYNNQTITPTTGTKLYFFYKNNGVVRIILEFYDEYGKPMLLGITAPYIPTGISKAFKAIRDRFSKKKDDDTDTEEEEDSDVPGSGDDDDDQGGGGGGGDRVNKLQESNDLPDLDLALLEPPEPEPPSQPERPPPSQPEPVPPSQPLPAPIALDKRFDLRDADQVTPPHPKLPVEPSTKNIIELNPQHPELVPIPIKDPMFPQISEEDTYAQPSAPQPAPKPLDIEVVERPSDIEDDEKGETISDQQLNLEELEHKIEQRKKAENKTIEQHRKEINKIINQFKQIKKDQHKRFKKQEREYDQEAEAEEKVRLKRELEDLIEDLQNTNDQQERKKIRVQIAQKKEQLKKMKDVQEPKRKLTNPFGDPRKRNDPEQIVSLLSDTDDDISEEPVSPQRNETDITDPKDKNRDREPDDDGAPQPLLDDDHEYDDDQDVVDEMERTKGDEMRHKLQQEINELQQSYDETQNINEQMFLKQKIDVKQKELNVLPDIMDNNTHNTPPDVSDDRPATEAENRDIQDVLDETEQDFFSTQPLNTKLTTTVDTIENMAVPDLDNILDMEPVEQTGDIVGQQPKTLALATMTLSSLTNQLAQMDEVHHILDLPTMEQRAQEQQRSQQGSRGTALARRPSGSQSVATRGSTLIKVENSANEFIPEDQPYISQHQQTFGQISAKLDKEQQQQFKEKTEKQTQSIIKTMLMLDDEQRDTVFRYAEAQKLNSLKDADDIDGQMYDLLEAYETSLPTIVVKDLQDFGNFAGKALYDSVPGHAVRGFVHGLWDSLASLAKSTGLQDFGKDTAYQLDDLDFSLNSNMNDGSYQRTTRNNKIKTKLMDIEHQLAQKIVQLPPKDVRQMRDHFKFLKEQRNQSEFGPEHMEQLQSFRNTMKKYNIFDLFFTNIPRKSNPQETKLAVLDRPSTNKNITRFQNRVYEATDDIVQMYEGPKQPKFKRNPNAQWDARDMQEYERAVQEIENPVLKRLREYDDVMQRRSAADAVLMAIDPDPKPDPITEPEVIKVQGNTHRLNLNKGQAKHASVNIGGNRHRLDLDKGQAKHASVNIGGNRHKLQLNKKTGRRPPPKSRSQQMKQFPGRGRRSSMKPNI